MSKRKPPIKRPVKMSRSRCPVTRLYNIVGDDRILCAGLIRDDMRYIAAAINAALERDREK